MSPTVPTHALLDRAEELIDAGKPLEAQPVLDLATTKIAGGDGTDSDERRAMLLHVRLLTSFGADPLN
jgi:hypothetical protein